MLSWWWWWWGANKCSYKIVERKKFEYPPDPVFENSFNFGSTLLDIIATYLLKGKQIQLNLYFTAGRWKRFKFFKLWSLAFHFLNIMKYSTRKFYGHSQQLRKWEAFQFQFDRRGQSCQCWDSHQNIRLHIGRGTHVNVVLLHISPVLHKLHWLPVSSRIEFKIATLTFKVLKFQQPAYIYDLIAPYIPPRSLRSSNKNLLIVPDIRSEMGRRSFSFASPSIWNSLPQHVRSSDSLSAFHGLLKTFLYQKSLPP